MASIGNRALVFCPPCARSGVESAFRLESVGYLQSLRAVSYSCPSCGHTTAVSLRPGALRLPAPGQCWNCGVATAADGDTCPSCSVLLRPTEGRLDDLLFTSARDELGPRPDDREPLSRALADARRERRLTDALIAANRLTHGFPDDAAAWRAKAELYLEQGFLPLALAACKQALRLQPDDVSTVLAFANIVELLDESEAALDAVVHAARLAPDDPRPDAAAASLLERLERFDEARAAAERAIGNDRKHAAAWATLATLHMRGKEFAAACRCWDEVLAAAPDFPLAWRYKGMCHLYREQWSEAAASGLGAGDGDDEALELVFEAYLRGGELDRALAHAERTVRARPDQSRFLYLKARAHLARGELDAGLAACDDIIALEPKAAWPKKARQVFVDRMRPADAAE